MSKLSRPPGASDQRRALCFADVEIDLEKAQLRRAGRVTTLSGLSASLLDYLVQHRERVVSREELPAEVWRGVTVSDGSLRQAVSELRQALGDNAERPRIIETVRGRGYCFAAALRDEDSTVTPGPSVSSVPAPSAAPDSYTALAAPDASRIFCGRARELARMEGILRESLQHGGRACVIVGPAGIGKSHLARELVRFARNHRIACVGGHADPDGFAPAFWPWKQVLADYLKLAAPNSRARYEAMAPTSFRLLAARAAARTDPKPPPTEGSHAEQRFLLVDELAHLFAAMASDVPGLMLLEDLQWADESSLALLGHVAPKLARTGSLLVVTSRLLRPSENRALARALDALGRSALSERVELARLTLEDIESMLEAHGVGGQVPHTLAAEVRQLSGGNPLFALKLARVFARCNAASRTRLLHEKLEIQQLIARHLCALPESAHQTISAAAVLSSEFALGELAGILQEPAGFTLDRLDVGIEYGLLVEVQGTAGTRFRFAHPLMRACAHDALPRSERIRLHRLAGEWIERHSASVGDGRSNELAHHFFHAAPDGVARKAMYYALRCAEQACASMAHADAVAHYGRALASADLDPSVTVAEKLEIELMQGDALRASGADAARVDRHFAAIAERADILGDAQLFSRAVLGYTGQRSERFTPTHFLVGSN